MMVCAQTQHYIPVLFHTSLDMLRFPLVEACLKLGKHIFQKQIGAGIHFHVFVFSQYFYHGRDNLRPVKRTQRQEKYVKTLDHRGTEPNVPD